MTLDELITTLEAEDPGYDYAVNASLSEATVRALAARLAAGNFPVRRVRRLTQPPSETPPAPNRTPMRQPTPPTPPDARGDHWERQHLHALFVDGIPGCGCGWPADAYNLVRDLLNLVPFYGAGTRKKVAELIGTRGAVHIILSAMQDAGLIDHGTSAMSSWITGKGKYARWLMARHEWDDAPGADDGVCEAGFPPCHDWDAGRCPDACWVAPPGVLPEEPPERSLQEITETILRQADEARARMTPAQRSVSDAVGKAMEDLLRGEQYMLRQPFPPGVGAGFTGMIGGGPGWPAGLVPGDWSTVSSREIVLPDPGYIGKIRRATVPLPTEEDRLSRGGRNVFIGCRQVDRTWIHGRPHDCPRHARG